MTTIAPRGRNRRPQAPDQPAYLAELEAEGAEFVTLHHQAATAVARMEGKKGHVPLKDKLKTILMNLPAAGEDGHRTHLFKAPVVFEDGSRANGLRLERRGGGKVWEEDTALAGLRSLGFTPRQIKALTTTVKHPEQVIEAYEETYLDEDKVVALLKQGSEGGLSLEQVRVLYRSTEPTYALSVI